MGPDEISNTVLKTCAQELAPCISEIFQKSVDQGVLPTDWLKANVAPVFKKGDVHAAENYRPVSLTCVLCKTLEHIICKHIMKHLEHHKILTDLNHGLRLLVHHSANSYIGGPYQMLRQQHTNGYGNIGFLQSI